MNLISEALISLNNIPSLVENYTGKRPHIATIYRWSKHGIAGVVLETISIGGSSFSSEEALLRFWENSTKSKKKPSDSIEPNPKTQRRQIELDQLAKELGI